MSDDDLARLGDLDGERPNLAELRVTGKAIADRAMLRGERVALAVVGVVTQVAFKATDGDALVRIHTIKAETVGEATDQLGEDVARFLRDVEDAREGRTALPLEDDPDEDE